MFMAGVGIVIGSQAPEFSQQYRQRLGGAVDELRIVVEDFDRDAADNNLTRRTALDKMVASDDQLVRDRGATMSGTISRHKRIAGQLREFEQASELTQPFIVLKAIDQPIAMRALEVYRPA